MRNDAHQYFLSISNELGQEYWEIVIAGINWSWAKFAFENPI